MLTGRFVGMLRGSTGTVIERGRDPTDCQFSLMTTTPLPPKKQRLVHFRPLILVQATIYCRLLIGRDDHLDQSEAYDIS